MVRTAVESTSWWSAWSQGGGFEIGFGVDGGDPRAQVVDLPGEVAEGIHGCTPDGSLVCGCRSEAWWGDPAHGAPGTEVGLLRDVGCASGCGVNEHQRRGSARRPWDRGPLARKRCEKSGGSRSQNRLPSTTFPVDEKLDLGKNRGNKLGKKPVANITSHPGSRPGSDPGSQVTHHTALEPTSGRPEFVPTLFPRRPALGRKTP